MGKSEGAAAPPATTTTGNASRLPLVLHFGQRTHFHRERGESDEHELFEGDPPRRVRLEFAKLLKSSHFGEEQPELPKCRDTAKERREDQNPDYEASELGSFRAVASPGTVDLLSVLLMATSYQSRRASILEDPRLPILLAKEMLAGWTSWGMNPFISKSLGIF